MAYLLLKQTDTNLKIAQAIQNREEELTAYQFELDSHNASIIALGNIAWDDTTSKYRGLPRDQMIARAMADGLTSDQIQAIGNLAALDQHQIGVQAVTIEMSKAQRIYNSALVALPAGADRDTAFASLAAQDASPTPTP